MIISWRVELYKTGFYEWPSTSIMIKIIIFNKMKGYDNWRGRNRVDVMVLRNRYTERRF